MVQEAGIETLVIVAYVVTMKLNVNLTQTVPLDSSAIEPTRFASDARTYPETH